MNNIKKYFYENLYHSVVKMMGLPVEKQMKFLKHSQFLPSSQIELLQKNKLSLILINAVTNIPFYINAFQGKNINNLTINDFPFVTKNDVRKKPSDFLSKNKMRVFKKTTGGSTGETLTVYKDASAFSNALAATWRGYEWAGVFIGNKQARFWGIPITYHGKIKMRLTDLIARRQRYSAFSFNEINLRNYTNQLICFKPDYFYGYVSMLNQYAEYILKNEISFPHIMKSIITTAEVLTKDIKVKIENAFGVKVFNEYGCGEFGTIAHECEYGNLHVNDENMLIEIYDGDRKCNYNEVGEIVVTELNNFAMPLIKYRLGDYASINKKKCECGRELKIIKNLYGRAYDMIKNKNGKLFHGEFFMYVFEEAKRKGLGITAFQVVQKDDDLFTIKIVPDIGYSKKSEQYILQYFKDNYSENVVLQFEKVSEIKRAISGKMRLIIGKNDSMSAQ